MPAEGTIDFEFAAPALRHFLRPFCQRTGFREHLGHRGNVCLESGAPTACPVLHRDSHCFAGWTCRDAYSFTGAVLLPPVFVSIGGRCCRRGAPHRKCLRSGAKLRTFGHAGFVLFGSAAPPSLTTPWIHRVAIAGSTAAVCRRLQR